MGKKLAISGHSTRGEEVIKLLEMLGGKNKFDYDGKSIMYSYYVSGHAILNDRLSIIEDDDFIIFNLEDTPKLLSRSLELFGPSKSSFRAFLCWETAISDASIVLLVASSELPLELIIPLICAAPVLTLERSRTGRMTG